MNAQKILIFSCLSVACYFLSGCGEKEAEVWNERNLANLVELCVKAADARINEFVAQNPGLADDVKIRLESARSANVDVCECQWNEVSNRWLLSEVNTESKKEIYTFMSDLSQPGRLCYLENFL